ncbi:MAG: hypothetical protein CL568_00640 [Alphaproteobacteria bacterium]|nr:hypothetical protein [Alphaproteobacteria bacterium]PPR13148.1 MAG: Acetylornithine deacetylase [Alphaproteobacteria bacterium MarineAlpha12_Bin1]|tara:strand:+ start:11834 stop:13225 length:1392 start_codon:yes stop_codon:yes gene_type:complete
MSNDRNKIIKSIEKYFDDGEFIKDLNLLIESKTESQIDNSLETLNNYFLNHLTPSLNKYGFKTEISDNPNPKAGPLLIAERIENKDLPTILIYGHSDVVVGQEDEWDRGLDPWNLTIKEDKIFGRGTADNKGQHWIIISSLQHVIKETGNLGFNCKILIESDEEMGSRGLYDFCASRSDDLSADVLIASDGPRVDPDKATIVLGSRGLINFEMSLHLRKGSHHSGNWGGLISDPGIILSNAISSIVDQRGQIMIPSWKPNSLNNEIRDIIKKLKISGGSNSPPIDENWGEIDLSPEERVFGWNSFSVLAMDLGDIERTQNAIAPSARAICQLRYVVGTNPDDILPSLKKHLIEKGYKDIKVRPSRMSSMKATRLDHNNYWAKLTNYSIQKTLGKPAAVVPNIGGSIPNDVFMNTLNLSTIWIPHSYPGCSQHAPNEHMLSSIAREGLQIMTGLFWDIGNDLPK